MTSAKVDLASEKARVLDHETQELLNSARKNNNRAMAAFVISWSLLFLVGAAGIYYQNYYAAQNKAHIDCIVKLLATPTQPGQSRRIADLGTCQIKVGS